MFRKSAMLERENAPPPIPSEIDRSAKNCKRYLNETDQSPPNISTTNNANPAMDTTTNMETESTVWNSIAVKERIIASKKPPSFYYGSDDEDDFNEELEKTGYHDP